MANENKNVTTSANEKTEVKKIGSGQKMRELLMSGWDNPKAGIMPEKIVEMIVTEYKAKTKINDLYFQANKLRHDEVTKPDYGKLLLRDYVKQIEDATGVTAKKEAAKAEEAKAKAATKKQKEAEAAAKAKTTEEKAA